MISFVSLQSQDSHTQHLSLTQSPSFPPPAFILPIPAVFLPSPTSTNISLIPVFHLVFGSVLPFHLYNFIYYLAYHSFS